jgi:hypothetical protein
VLGQILLIFPLVFWAAIFGTKKILGHRIAASEANSKVNGKKHGENPHHFLIYFAWLPLLFFFISSLRAVVEANWPIIAYPAVFALALFHHRIEKWTQWTSVFWGALAAVVLSGILIPQLRQLNEKFNEPFVYMSVAEQVKGYQPLYAQTHQLTSMISYTLKEDVYKIRGINRFDFFDMIPESVPTSPEFYMVARRGAVMPEWVAEAGYHKMVIKPVAPIYELLKFSKDSGAVNSSR